MVVLSRDDRAILEDCLTIHGAIPERYRTIEAIAELHDVPPTREEVRAMFEAVERYHLRLGPPRSNEPDSQDIDLESADYLELGQALVASPLDADQYLHILNRFESELGTPDGMLLRPRPCTWEGILRMWLRARGGGLADDAIHGINTQRASDQANREFALERIEALALLINDRQRGVWLWFHGACLQEASLPFAAEMYHHPLAGRFVKSTVEREYLPEDLVWIKAHPPATFREAPWDNPG